MKHSFPKIILHLEGAAVLLIALIFFQRISSNWLYFILIFIAIDLSMLGYIINKKIGSYIYNIFHIYAWPLGFITYGIFTLHAPCVELGLIWLAHIGADRLMGYGLKYPTGFKETHLKRI